MSSARVIHCSLANSVTVSLRSRMIYYTFTSMAWIGTAVCLLLKQGQSHELEPVSMAIYKLKRYSHMNSDLFSR